MDKTLFIKIAVVGVVLLFMFEIVSLGFLGGNQNSGGGEIPQVTQYAGLVQAGAYIDYYERFLYAVEIDAETLGELKQMNEVEGVEFADGSYKIDLKQREDVQKIYNYLKSKGIDSVTNAKAILDPSVTLQISADESITGSFQNRKIKLELIQPIVPPGNNITLQMQVVIQNGDAYPAGEIKIPLISKNIELNAVIFEKEKLESYIIPWENRDEINIEELQEQYGEENVSYERNNAVIFSKPLTPMEQLEKKFDYVVFINEEMIVVEEDYVDSEKIMSDFDQNLTFSESNLIISGESSFEFEKEIEYEYLVEFNSNEYTLLDNKGTVISPEEFELNQTIKVDVQASMIEETVVETNYLALASS